MSLHENIYRYRKAQGLTQEELAVLCDVSRQAISKWENDTANPDIENLKALASALQVSCDELLGNASSQAKDDTQQDHQTVYVQRIRYGVTKEYTSRLNIFGIPLVQINIGKGKSSERKRRVAKGIIAIGNTSIGLISIGLMSFGVLSFGLLGIGLFSIGCLAIGGYALGSIAIGYIGIGALAIGMYSIGALSIGFHTSVGALSYGTTAIGVNAFGEHALLLRGNNSCFLHLQEYRWIQQQLDNLPFLMRVLIQAIPFCG